MGDSFMRMIEAGRSPLHISRAFNLVTTFNDADIPIDFPMTMKFLGAVQFLEGGKEDGKKDGVGWTPFIKKLSEIDADFEKFFDKIGTFLDGVDEKEVDDPDESVLHELAVFLSTPDYSRKNTERFNTKLISDIMETASLTLELTLDIFATMKKHPPLHIGETAIEWEMENKDNFSDLKAVYGKKEWILNKGNLERFPHFYIRSSNFMSMEYIFMDGGDSDEVRAEFIKMVSDSWVKNLKVDPMSEAEKKKVNVRCINRKDIEPAISDLLKRKNNRYEAFWVFTTIRGNQIGFLGLQGDNLEHIINLSFADSSSKAEQFSGIKKLIK